MMAPNFYLGVDGGGSRCRARLESEDDRVLGQGVAGPATMRFGFEATRAAIMDATGQALREAGLGEDALKQTYVGAGLAGIGIPGARDALSAWAHPFAGIWFEGDGYVAFLGAFGGKDGGIVIAGTGSIGLAYPEGSDTIRIGGYGFPVSDEGSGAHIGINALRYALRSLDGRAEPSDFSSDVLARISTNPATIYAWVERATATDYAALAPIVAKHAALGHPAARRLMQAAGAQIAELVETLFERGAPRVAVLGGLAESLRDYMPPEVAARLVAPEADAMAGGILLAKRRAASK